MEHGGSNIQNRFVSTSTYIYTYLVVIAERVLRYRVKIGSGQASALLNPPRFAPPTPHPPRHLLGELSRCSYGFIRFTHEAHDLNPLRDNAVFRLNAACCTRCLKHEPSADRQKHLSPPTQAPPAEKKQKQTDEMGLSEFVSPIEESIHFHIDQIVGKSTVTVAMQSIAWPRLEHV